MKFSSTFNTSVQRSYIFYFKIGALILSPFFWKLSSENYLNSQVRINKMVNKHTVDYHPSSSQLTSRIYPLRFLCTPRGFIFSESFLNFFLNLYIPPWLQKSFKFIVLRLLQIHLRVKKLNLFIFTHAPMQNSSPGFYRYPPGRKELSIPIEKCFFKIFFLRRKGGREKIMDLKKLTKVSVISFDKFHHLCNLYIFGWCFVVQ